jgi:hypothetical protein
MSDAGEPEILRKEGGGAPSPGPSDPNPKAAIAGLTLGNLARGLKVVALLPFLLPWVTVSCAEQTLVSLSGMDLATGSVTVTNPMTGESASPAGSGESDLPVLIAAILIAAALAASFLLRGRLAAMVSTAALAVAAALISYSVLLRIPERARESATADSAQGISEAQIADLIRVDVAVGFWLTLAALVGAIALTLLGARSQAPPGD